MGVIRYNFNNIRGHQNGGGGDSGDEWIYISSDGYVLDLILIMIMILLLITIVKNHLLDKMILVRIIKTMAVHIVNHHRIINRIENYYQPNQNQHFRLLVPKEKAIKNLDVMLMVH